MKVATNLIKFNKGITLESGDELQTFELIIETYGELNKDKSNAILVCHAFSGNHHAAGINDAEVEGWWTQIIGPDKAIDTNNYYVVCCNNLGGCSGSSGPTSINPDTSEVFGKDFPQVSVKDWVKSQKMLSDHLGIDKWELVLGGSLGGMQALQLSLIHI